MANALMWDAAALNNIGATFPGLTYAPMSGLVSGRLAFKATSTSQGLILNPKFGQDTSNEEFRHYIADNYCVEFSWQGDLPVLKETSSRVIHFAADNNLDSADLHINGDGTACLCSEPQLRREVRNGLTPEAYVHRLAIPFFYGQSFFQRFGTWPWRQLGHGYWGNIEWLGLTHDPSSEDVLAVVASLKIKEQDFKKILSIRPRRHHQCPCGSGKKISKCHSLLVPGIQVLQKWIDPKKQF
jgi:hypothetical protein